MSRDGAPDRIHPAAVSIWRPSPGCAAVYGAEHENEPTCPRQVVMVECAPCVQPHSMGTTLHRPNSGRMFPSNPLHREESITDMVQVVFAVALIGVVPLAGMLGFGTEAVAL
jgi:hypothetical protein